MSFLILNIDFETLHFQYWFWFLILKLPCTVYKSTRNSPMHTHAFLCFIDFDFESWFWLVEFSRFLILILNSDIFSRIFFLILILTISLSFQEFWFWYWIFLHLFNKIDFGFEIFYTFQKSWYWYWLCCKYFKNFDIDIESLQFFSRMLILILTVFCQFQQSWFWHEIFKGFQDSWSWYWSKKAILAHLWQIYIYRCIYTDILGWVKMTQM